MALDASIPQSGRAPLAQMANPVDSMAGILKLRQAEAETAEKVAERAQKEAEEQDFRSAVQQHQLPDGSPDWDAVVNALAPKYPDRAIALKGEIGKARTSAAEAMTKSTAATLAQYQAGSSLIAQMLEGGPDAHATLYPLLEQLSPEVAGLVRDYNPERLTALSNLGRSQAEMFKERMEALQAWSAGDLDGGFLRFARTARNDEEYQTFKREARAMGVGKALIDTLPPTWTPDVPALIGKMSMTAKDEETLAGQAAARAETHRSNLADEATARTSANTAAARERRLGEEDRTPAGGAPKTDAVGLRQARQWKVDALADLEKRRKGISTGAAGRGTSSWTSSAGAATGTKMSDADYQAEKQWIEDQYRFLIGETHSAPPPPGGDTAQPAGAGAARPAAPARVQSPGAAERGAPPAPRQRQAFAKDVVPGAVVTLKDGRKIRIKQLDANGRIVDYEQVSK